MQPLPLPLDPTSAAPAVAARGKLSLRLLLGYCIVLVVGWIALLVHVVARENDPAAAQVTAEVPLPASVKPFIARLHNEGEAVAALQEHTGPLPPGTLEALERTCAQSTNRHFHREVLEELNKRDPKLAGSLFLSQLTHRDYTLRTELARDLASTMRPSLSEDEVVRFMESIPNAADRDSFRTAMLPKLAPGAAAQNQIAALPTSGPERATKLRSMLSDATRSGDISAVRELLQAGADPLSRARNESSMLELAAAMGRTEALRLFLEKAEGSPEPARALVAAASQGQLDCVNILLAADVPPDSLSSNGWSALYFASERGHPKVVVRLIEAGANVELNRRGSHLRPLHVARDGATVRMLVGAGAKIEVENASPLHAMAGWDHHEAMETLLELGAKPDSLSKGEPPLVAAARIGSERCVRLLVEHGANVSLANARGDTPLSIAESRGHTKVAQYLREQGAGK